MNHSENMMRGIGMTSQRTRDRLIKTLREQGVNDERVLELISKVPRHLFVDEALASRAYENTALPIGFKQTISQPWVVARMTELLLEGCGCAVGENIPKVLEVGTGCGYQTAVLSQVADAVYSVERIEHLLERTRKRMRAFRFSNIRYIHSDGSWGWPDHGPYNGILAAAAAQSLPPELPKQLAPGGALVMPVGPEGQQRLLRVINNNGTLQQQWFEPVSFVPMLSGVLR